MTSWLTMLITNSKTPSLSLSTTLPGEAVGDDDIDRAAMDVAALDVADEPVLQRAVAEQVVGLLNEVVPLPFFLADIHQADGGLFDAEDLLREHRAHDAVFEQMARLGEDIGADVDDDAAAPSRWA